MYVNYCVFNIKVKMFVYNNNLTQRETRITTCSKEYPKKKKSMLLKKQSYHKLVRL